MTNLTYDPLGRLFEVKQTRNGSTQTDTQFLYDGDALVLEYDNIRAGAPVSNRYVHGSNAAADDPLVWYSGNNLNTVRYLHADHMGSIVGIANGTGTSYATNSYDEYGINGSSNNASERFGYTGQAYIPELDLDYYKARFYSARLGRFLQTDPIGYAGGINIYEYAGDDPVDFEDLMGTDCCYGPEGYHSPPLDPEAGAQEARVIYELSGAKDIVDFFKNPTPRTFFWAAINFIPAERIAAGGRLVIGELRELNALRKGEFALKWVDKGSPKANWKENSSLLRSAMSEGKPIRDTHVDPKTGALLDESKKDSFLRAERNLLRDRGWDYNSKTRTWNPGRTCNTAETRLC